MPSREWWLRVQDILSAINSIHHYTRDLTFDEFQADTRTLQAVLYNFIIIGEAVRSIPVEIQARYSKIPWREIGDVRNIAAHEYFQVRLIILWDTIQDDLPTLAIQLQELLDRELSNES